MQKIKGAKLLLTTAADIIYAGNWTQRKYSTMDRSRYCAMGALCEACQQLGMRPSTYSKAVRAIQVTHGLFDLVTFNDRRGRTAEEIGLILYKAAERCD